MGVGEQEVRVNLITAEDAKRLLDLRETPDNLHAFQGTGRVHVHIVGKQVRSSPARRWKRDETKPIPSQPVPARRTDEQDSSDDANCWILCHRPLCVFARFGRPLGDMRGNVIGIVRGCQTTLRLMVGYSQFS